MQAKDILAQFGGFPQASLATSQDTQIVIGGAALLDHHLYNLLAASLYGDRAVVGLLLSQYRHRRHLAYCIGLIGERQFDDLCLINKMRNRFAHDYPQPTFEQESMRVLVSRLSLYHEGLTLGLDRRAIFVQTVYGLARYLNERLLQVKRVKGG